VVERVTRRTITAREKRDLILESFMTELAERSLDLVTNIQIDAD